MQNIVLGYDGSENADRALQRVAAIANGATVTVVSAVHVHPAAASKTGSQIVDPDEVEERQRSLAKAKEFLTSKDIQVQTVEAHGDPAAAILEEAETEHADMILVGTRGRNPVERLILGSVSTKVVHGAHCDVLVVR